MTPRSSPSNVPIDRRLSCRLRRAGAWRGASWLPRLCDDGFLLAAVREGDWLTLSAIGGKLEGSETFLEAARREYQEETGTPPPTWLPQAEPLLLGAELESDENAEGAAVLLRKRPHGHGADAPWLWIGVFLGRTDTPPRPVEKIPAFAVVPPAAFAALTGSEVPAALRFIGDASVAAGARLRLRDTAAVLARAPGALDELWRRAEEAASGVTR